MRNLPILISLFCCLSAGFCLAQNWQSVSDELNSYGVVRSLYADPEGGGLYVSGSFDNIGGNTDLRSIALWKDSQWHALANGLNSYMFPASIRGIVRYNGEIYVCGGLTDANGLTCNGIARWDGSQWASVGEGLLDYDDNPAFTHNLRVIGDELYACGLIHTAGNVSANGIAKWNGTSWSSVHDFPSFGQEGVRVTDCIIYDGELYVCGSFNHAGSGTGMAGIAKWNGSDWVGVGPVGVGQASCMEVYEGKLYVGGYFSSMMNPALPGNNIASWDGNSWDNVGGGMGSSNGTVYDMMIHDGKLYVAGGFTSVGGIPARFIATWDGHEWCDLGSTSDNGIYTIEEFQDTLYIGGEFTELNGQEIFSVAKSGGPVEVENCGTLAGVEDAATDDGVLLSVFPTPTPGPLTITSTKPLLSVAVVDMLGRVLCSERDNSSTSMTFDLSHLPAGIYVVQSETEVGRWAQRVVRE